MRHGVMLVLGALIACAAGPARATDHLQETLRLVMSRSSTGRESFVWITKLPAPPLPADDPGVVGADLEVRNPITGLANLFSLPPGEGWHTNAAGTIHKFVNPAAPGGLSEIKVAIIKGGTLIKVVGRELGSSLNGPSQGAMAVILSVGTSDR